MTTLLTSAEKNKLIVALTLAMFLAAVEGTIVTLAIPTIVGDLRGFDLISHVFSLYLLTGALATPIYGKLSDLYGRKRILMVGIIIFLAGSALCGLAQDMVALIIFRAVQGIGAGAIYLVPMVIVGDVFPLSERGKVQGMLSMVWGVAGLLGPFLGGLLIDLLSWHWIFFINIPFGLLTIAILQTSFTEDFHRKRHHIDFPGIVTLTLAMLAFLAIFVFADEGATLFTARNALLLAASVLLLLMFYRIEKRSLEPIVPFDVLTKSSVFVNITSLLLMVVIFAFDVYTPLYLQNVRGLTPLVAGLALLASSLSWMLVSIPLGKLMLRFGGKLLNAVGMGATFLALVPLLLFAQDSSLVFVVAVAFLFGIGPGIAMTTQMMIIQNSVGFEKRGAAVGVNSLVRTLGQTVGISVFGALFNARIVEGFSAEGITRYDLGNLYDLAAYQENVSWSQVVAVLLDSVHVVYFALIIIAVVGLLFSLFMPRPVLSSEIPGSKAVPESCADTSA
jgi:EmrB/QacA subfamily drug resistance transporter